jgi:hypothetical protein
MMSYHYLRYIYFSGTLYLKHYLKHLSVIIFLVSKFKNTSNTTFLNEVSIYL